MQIWGKVIGALLGFMFGRIPGALLGLVIGHFFDSSYGRGLNGSGGFARFFTSQDDLQRRAEFFHALFSSLGHIAKADGKVTEKDIQNASQLMRDMQLSEEVTLEAQQAFREGKDRDFPIEKMLKEFKQSCHGRADILQIFLEMLIQSACVNGRLSASKYAVLGKIAKSLGFSPKELGFLVATFEAGNRFRHGQANQQQQSHQRSRQSHYHNSQDNYSSASALQDAYRILGVDEKADETKIKRAYKKAMSTHHPDKLMSKGLPEQALEMAKVKTQEIQGAYSLIRKKRGF